MRTWFITGAERGLGASIAERALAWGESVVVATMRNPAHITASLGAHEQLLVVPLDVTNEAHARAAVASALRRFGRIDALVNNAGYGLLGAVEEASAAEVERVFRINVFGLLNVTRAVLPQMRKQRHGHIVNISSAGSDQAGPGWGIHCATKSAVESISEALSKEGEPLGIYTTVVESGYPRRGSRSSSPLISTAQRIDDYRHTVGPMRTSATSAGHPPGDDLDELTDAILSLVDAPDPPRHLPLETEAFRVFEAKQDTGVREVEPWRSLVLSADFAT